MVETVIQTPSSGLRAQDGVPTERVRDPRPRRIPEHWWGYVLLAPAVLMVVGMILYPVAYSFWVSLHHKHAYLPIETWAGLSNFHYFLFEDPEFWRSLKLGAIYAFGSVVLQLIVGVGAALLLNETFVGRGFVRALALFPYMLPTIVVVILMRWIFNDSYGVLKFALETSGLVDRAYVWFDPDNIMLTLILVSTWTFFPFVLISVLARLQTISQELYDAAKVDGAGLLRAVPARDAAADRQCAVRRGAAALHVHVHEVRPDLFVRRCRRARHVRAHVADLHVRQVVRRVAGRHGRGALGHHVHDARRLRSPLFPHLPPGREPMTRNAATASLGRLIVYGSAALLTFLCGFPLLWMVLTSIKPDREILTPVPTFWTSQPTLGAYGRLFAETKFLTYFWNSIFVAGCATLLTILVATLAAYGITRFRFRGRETIAGTMLFTYMFAPIMIVVPFYILMRGAGLTNSHLGLILAYTTFSLPFSMWMLRSFFQSIPLELEEAAMIDGASRPKAVRLIIVPLALPGVIAVSIFTFIVAWNDYLFVRVLIGADNLKTLPVGIQDLYESTITDWGMVMAAGVMITIPALLFFIAVQRYLIAGWGTGGVKG